MTDTAKYLFYIACTWLVATRVTAADVPVAKGDCLHSPLATELQDQYPGWSIVDVKHLGDWEGTQWVEAHGDICPGLAKGKFYSKTTDAYAVALYRPHGEQYEEQVILLPVSGHGVRGTVLMKPEVLPYLSVVWRLPPDQYESTDGKKFNVSQDVILYEAIGVGSVLIYRKARGFKWRIISE